MILKKLVAGRIDAIAGFAGTARIKGQAKNMGQAIQCRIELYGKSAKKLVATQVTDKQGNYEFINLAPVQFFIVAHHPASQFNAVIQDNVVPK